MGSIRNVSVDEMILRKSMLFVFLHFLGQVDYIWGRGMFADIQLQFN